MDKDGEVGRGSSSRMDKLHQSSDGVCQVPPRTALGTQAFSLQLWIELAYAMLPS